MTRIAITGIGIVSPIGLTQEENWRNLVAGNSGIKHIETFDTEKYPTSIAGIVPPFELEESILSPREAKKYDEFIKYALKAANEAIEQAKEPQKYYAPEKAGVILGVGIGGFHAIEKAIKSDHEKGPRRVSPFFIPSMIPNMAAGAVSLRWNLRGTSFVTTSACASSNHAFLMAAEEIRSGRADMMITGGTESGTVAACVAGFGNMKALAKATKEDDPKVFSRPFDKERSGFVIGEGSAIFVLESEEKANKRGANILGYYLGGGSSSDAFHITSPDPKGTGAKSSMKMAVENSKVSTQEIDYINAHATSTPLGDLAESRAINSVFPHGPKVNSTKSYTGHALGAAGALESAFTLLAMKNLFLPATLNLRNPDPECSINHVLAAGEKTKIKYALNNSFGFGGTNCSLIFQSHH